MTPPRQLGLWSAIALVVANMIGTGVFTTSGFLIKDLGSPWAVLVVWAVGGVVATLGALCYGALARQIPESGGEYLFLSRTLHPAAGYTAGWLSLLVGFSAPLAAVAYGFGEYARPWLRGCAPQLSGSVLLLVFASLHARDVQQGAWVQNGIVGVKILLILAFGTYGLAHLPPPDRPDLGPAPPSVFAVSLVWVFFSYCGWNAAVYVGGEVKNPDRTLPRSLLLATGLVTALYLVLNAVFVFSVPVDRLAGQLDVGRIAAEAIGGPGLAQAVTGLILLALGTSVSSMMMAGPRVYAQMAADGFLPRWVATPAGPPRAAIGIQLGLALLMLWTASYEALLTYIGFTLSLSTAATVVGLMRLRRQSGTQILVPGWPWMPAVFIGIVLAMTGFTVLRRPTESLLGLATLAAGWVAWRWVRRP